jgi:hypothetical protein
MKNDVESTEEEQIKDETDCFARLRGIGENQNVTPKTRQQKC